VVWGCAAGLLGLLLLDCILFRWSPYAEYLSPESSTGTFELIYRTELFRKKDGTKQILGIGDSRMALVPREANEESAGTGYTFASAGVPGSSPRCWYYMLRDLDPTGDRYTAILIMVDDFADEDSADEWGERLSDLALVAARLRWSDIIEFTFSYRTLAHRWEAFRGSLLKGFAYKLDVENFLANPRRRLKEVEEARRDFARNVYNFPGVEQSMKGLRVDWQQKKVVAYPPGVKPEEIEKLHDVFFPWRAPHTGRETAYRMKWLGKIVDHYRGSKTRIIFVRPPREALVRPDWSAGRVSSAVRALASRPGVTLLDENTFVDLEKPEYFKDPVHLNREGLARFTQRMAAIVRSMV
jgi:hypothetical protein